MQGRDKAFAKQYDLAIIYMDEVIALAPNYFDAYLFKARIYSWQGKYAQAVTYLDSIDQIFPKTPQIPNIQATVLFWNDKLPQALEKCELSLDRDSTQTDLIYLKARLLFFLTRYKEALPIAEKLCADFPDNNDYKKLRTQIINNMAEDHIALWYSYDYFTDRRFINLASNTDTIVPGLPRNAISIEFKKVIGRSPFLLRLNGANRFNVTETQIELEAYPRVSKNLYFFLQGGYSGGALFPDLRLAAESFLAIPDNKEFSLGLRYLEFRTITFMMFTTSFSYYLGSYWLNGRYYRGISNLGNANIIEATARRYLNNVFHFVEIRAGLGNSPDVSYLQTVFDQVGLEKSRYFALAYNRNLSQRVYFKVWGIYNKQILPNSPNFSIISGNLGIWWRF